MFHATGTSAGRCFRLLLFSCGVSIGVGATPAHAVGQDLSGTITYSGTRVQVSDSEPILVFLFAIDPNADVVDGTYVSTNGGPFVLHAPAAGNYYLFYSVDVHDYRDGSASVGAPFQVYNHRFAFSYPEPPPADPVLVPQAGLQLTLDDTAIISGIAGTTTYTGQFPQGDIAPCICVEAFTDPLHTQADADDWCCGNQTRGTDMYTGRYELNHLHSSGGPYYLRVFVDLNDNRQLDPGEPVGNCSNPVVAGPDQTDVSITFDDTGTATCIVPSLPSPTPTVTPTPSTVTLSGTILYTGTQGPVSPSRRILVFLMDTPSVSSETTLFLKAKVSTNPGTFSFDVPAAGNYYLFYSLDEHNTGGVDVGTPFGVSGGRCNFPADPIAAPQTNVQLQFDDTCSPPGIAGNMTYTGNLGSVSAEQRLCLQAFVDPELLTNGWWGPPCGANEENNGEGYDMPTFDTRTYYLRAFLDLNGNRAFDVGEPFQIYNAKSGPPGDPVVASTTQSGINFTFGDENVIPSICVGDCNSDHSVTVDEILTMVNIALGNTPVGDCLAGDANGDHQITVDEILTAVNNALNGC